MNGTAQLDYLAAETALNQASGTIAIKEQHIAIARERLRQAERDLDALRQDYTLSVSLEIDAITNKPRYSNEAQRGAAISRALRDDPQSRQLSSAVDKLTNDLALLAVERDDAARRRQNALALLSYATSINYVMQPIPR